MNEPDTLSSLKKWAREEVELSDINVSELEVRLLLMTATGQSRETMVSDPDRPCSASEIALFKSYIKRRFDHEPVYRIIGRREFHGLNFELNDATLEPRDDTECLVEATLQKLQDRGHPWRFLDLGTGPGTVALALLQELPNATALGTDTQRAALQMAKTNATNAELGSRFSILESDWFDEVEGQFDFIVSNPPYIATSVIAQLDTAVRLFDPIVALDGGEDGLSAYRQILATAESYLTSTGFVALEIGYDQATDVSRLAVQHGWKNLSVIKDLAGNDRTVLAS